MSNRWKQIVAVLGAALMLVNTNGVLTVCAAEVGQESVQQEGGDVSEVKGEEAKNPEMKEEVEESMDKEEKAKDPEDEQESEKSEQEESEVKEEQAVQPLSNSTVSGNTVDADNTGKEEQEGIQAATDLTWDSSRPGWVKFNNPNNEKISYVVNLYYNGNNIYGASSWTNMAGDMYDDLSDGFNATGDYTFQVGFFEEGQETDWSLSTGIVSEVSSVLHYTRPSQQVAAPSNVTWDFTGRVTWDAVEHGGRYIVYLYRWGTNGYEYVTGMGVPECYVDFSSYIAQGYSYAVKVRAISANVNEYANGVETDYIVMDNSGSKEEINKKLDEAVTEENLASDKIENTVADVKSEFSDSTKKSELQIAMQQDSDTQEKISKLEESYKANKGVSVDAKAEGDTGVDTSSVKLLGAALNATESGSITFNMKKPDEQTQKDLITETRFTKGIVLDLGLEGAGITKGETLAIPVTVTMAVPAGMDVSKLAILHFNSDSKTYETLPVRLNSDGTISFTVTHFSYFAFVEKEQAQPSNPTQPSGGTSSSNQGTVSYSNGGDNSSNTAVSAPIVETWKPTTPDEIKRYAVYGKEKVVYTADKNNAYPVTVKNAMQGKKCFESFEAVLGEYTIGRTYNILPNGKRLYKMDKAVTITLSIPKELQAAGREFEMICVTEKGVPVILKDQDKDPATITITTDKFYAFALAYKDAKAKTK